MGDFNYLEMIDEFNVLQATLLIIGKHPAKVSDIIKNLSAVKNEEDYIAVRDVLVKSIMDKKLPARTAIAPGVDGLDLRKTTILRKDLKAWLRRKGLKPRFFYPEAYDQRPGYLNPEHPCYAPKLAAVVNAWLAIEEEFSAGVSKNPKMKLTTWLKEHGEEYGLLYDNGTPKGSVIENCAKIANWQPEGGAPRTDK